jgi:PAS domain S-box-containing protein
MKLDTHTMIVMIAVSCFLNMLLLLVQYLINRHFKGVSYWLVGFFILGISQIFASQRESLGVMGAVFLSDILLVVGFVILAIGLQIFLKQKPTPFIHGLLIGVILIAAFSYLYHKNEILEQAILLLVLGCLMLTLAKDMIVSHRQQKNFTALFLAILHIVYGCLFFLQSGLDFFTYQQPVESPASLLPWLYFMSFITANIATFCYVMLINNQLVTQRQHALDALQISETKYRHDFLLLQAILESPQDIIVFSVNKAYCYTAFTSFHEKLVKEFWGTSISVGSSVLEAIGSTSTRENTRKNLDRAFGGEVFVEEEMYNTTLNNYWFENWYSPIRNTQGIIEGVAVFVVDVSKRKSIEKEIVAAKNHFETLFKVSPDAAMITSFPDGNIIDVNDAFVNKTKFDKSEVIGKKTVEIGIWQNAKDRQTFIQNLIEKGVTINMEAGYQTKDGKGGIGIVSAKLYEVNGQKRVISITHDISARKKAEQEKEFEKKDKEALINSTSDMMWSVRKDYTFIAGNQSFLERLQLVTGKQAEPGMYLLDEQYFSKEIIAEWKQWYDTALAGHAVHTETQWKNPNGEITDWAELKMKAIEVNGEITGVACFWKIITESKQQAILLQQLNEQLKKRAEELALSNAELEQFAYIASHDLQEPLRMVSSFLALLEKRYSDNIDDKAKQYIHFAVDGADRMRQIIVDLLEYSRTGKTTQPIEKIDTNNLLEELTQINKEAIEEKKATVQWQDMPLLSGERLSLQQIFQNLITNALKYSKAGVPPVIQVQATEQAEHWQFAVKDNGIGIDPAFFKKIFIVFQRLHGRDDFSGNGIGLSICKKLIEQRGGRIWLSSTPGEGSTFYFTIKKL